VELVLSPRLLVMSIALSIRILNVFLVVTLLLMSVRTF